MPQDLAPVQRPATPCVNSPEWLANAKATLTETVSAADCLRQFARLSTVYGDARISTSDQRRLLLREWVEAFRDHAPAHLHEAVSRTIQGCKFWPTIAEILAEVRALRKSLLEDVQRQSAIGLPRPEKDDFASHGRTEAQERAFRASVILNAKKRYGWTGNAPAPVAAEPDLAPFDIPASDVSEALRTARARAGATRARK